MHIARPLLILALAAASALPAGTAQALCMASGAGCGEDVSGAKFLKPQKITPRPYDVGDVLPIDYQMLTNTGYYGLPAPRDGWVYFRVQHWLYRVDLTSREILEDATSEANRAF